MSHDLSPLGFRKTPFTRELQVRECFPLDPQAQVAAALAEAVHERMSAALIAPAGTGKTVALRMQGNRRRLRPLAHRHLSRSGAQAAGRFRTYHQRRYASGHPARRSP